MASLRVSMSILAFYLSYSILMSDYSLSQSSFCLPENHTALFIFGDSLFDVGNNDYINSSTFLQANFPPYGETFFKYPTGRFSDGRVIPDFIAEYAKLSLILPYLSPAGYHDHYIYGVNFASAGAGALVETNQGLRHVDNSKTLAFSHNVENARSSVPHSIEEIQKSSLKSQHLTLGEDLT
ncbi:GDSL esterase/lipase 5 [Spatholobus suberectus]|nr:GDSL esterase/lipase 5 [Spatholobus suberectus]